MRQTAKNALKKIKQAGVVGAATAAFAASVIATATGNHLACYVDGKKYGFALFSNIKDSNNNPMKTTLSELSHFDEEATAFGQYSIAAHTLLVLSSWAATYELLSRPADETAPFWYRCLIGAILIATLILAGLFIDIAENHSTAGIHIDNSPSKTYRVRAHRGTAGYTLQFVPLTLCFLLWIKDAH